MKQHLAAALALMTLAAQSGAPSRSPAGTGVIVGTVVNDQHQPVARVQVQAFSVRTVDEQARRGRTVPFSSRASGSAATDADGRFQIAGLDAGEYLVAAAPVPSVTSGASTHAPLYATTFYPSTIDDRAASRMSVPADTSAPIQLELVRVTGARIAGSVVSPSGRSVNGMEVRLFYRFGGFGSETSVARVSESGTFEIARVPPGWYRLTVVPPHDSPAIPGAEFATRLIEVRGDDIEGLALTLGTGASIAGRIVAESGSGVTSAVGMRVNASLSEDEYASPPGATATVSYDWSFRMSGLSGSYLFTAGADRSPFVKATRVVVDGRETTGGVSLTDGTHDLVVFVAPAEVPPPAIDKTLSSAALIERFKGEKVFFRQFAIAQAIVNRHDPGVLSSLEPWLTHEDRHIRGNTAFIFGGLGDPRGFQVITEILTDRSDRPEAQGIPTASSDGRYRVARQIATDRYYAAHLLGDLRDPRAVPVLAALLDDRDVQSIVPWSLSQIGDKRAVRPLLEALDKDDPSMRVFVIYALETLKAKEAIPRLITLLDDHRRANFGSQVSVADAARAALDTLR